MPPEHSTMTALFPQPLLHAATGLALCVALAAHAQPDTGLGAGHRAADATRNTRPDNGPEFAGEDGVRKGREQAFLTRVDTTFLNDAAKLAMAEVPAARLAAQKAKDPQLAAFARRLAEDFARSETELRRLAERKGVELPEGPSVVLRAQLRRLEGADRGEFDGRYREHLDTDAYADAVERFTEAADKAGDADVRAFARKHLPMLQRHLAQARQLAAGRPPGNAREREAPRAPG
jgi:putative membrane protein